VFPDCHIKIGNILTLKSLIVLTAAVATLGLMLPANAAQNVKIGSLRCDVSAGLGLIITSTRGLECTFVSSHGWREGYHGKIQRFGLDIGKTNAGVLLWDVFAPTDGPRRHALTGDYGGADASATVGVGVGANALVGGSHRSFTLQPLSVEGQTGLSLAAGVESLKLRSGH
jgi:hypothetical protein